MPFNIIERSWGYGKFVTGSAAAPSVASAAAPNFGIFFGGGGVRVAINGAQTALFDSSGLTLGTGGVVVAPNGFATSGSSGLWLSSTSDGVARISNAAGTDFGRLQFGGTTSAFPALKRSGNILQVKAADDSGYNTFDAGVYQLSSKLTISGAAPTISSGFGTSPSIVTSNGTAAFTINVGTGGSASSGVITLPAATTGWVVNVQNITAQDANRASVRTAQIATTTTTATIENQNVATGAATAWAASDILLITAMAY